MWSISTTFSRTHACSCKHRARAMRSPVACGTAWSTNSRCVHALARQTARVLFACSPAPILPDSPCAVRRQDTNEAQLELVRQWVSVHERLTVVGDEDQSIYSFRHATPECLRALKTLYPKLATLKLTVNFRSTAPVLHAANMVIGQDERREEKKVLRPTEEHSGNSAGVIVASVNTFDDQAVLLAKQIRSLLACGDFDRSSVAIRGPPVAPSALQPSDVAVLYRTGAVSGSVERQLRVEGVPYRIVGGLSFFDRMEVRDTLAFLRMITNEADAASFERAAELFAGVGPATIRKHLDKSAAAKRTPVQQLQRASGRLRQLAETVRGLQQHLDKGGGLEDLLDLLIKQCATAKPF